MKPVELYAAVTIGSPTLRGILGMDDEGRTVGTCYGALFFRRKFAKKLADQWPGSARVAKVRLIEVGPHAAKERKRDART